MSNSSDKIVYDLKLFGKASINARDIGANHEEAKLKAIKDKYLNTQYTLNQFNHYRRSYHVPEEIEEKYSKLSMLIDSKSNKESICLFIIKIVGDKFLYDKKYNNNIVKDGRVYFTCQFTARVIHIAPGNKFRVRVLKIKSDMIFIESFNQKLLGFIVKPSENNHINYSKSEEVEIDKLKVGDDILVESINNPQVNKFIICICKYVSTIKS